jgi:hypothetical protein
VWTLGGPRVQSGKRRELIAMVLRCLEKQLLQALHRMHLMKINWKKRL